MATVRELLDRKGSDLLMVGPETTVLEASRLMNDRGVGSVLVMTDGALTGIFTERDLMRRVVAVDRLPGATKVGEVMTSSLVTCTPDATMQDCGTVMSERRIRHLPVVDDSGVVGLVTTGDLLAHELKEKDAAIQQLESFVFYVRQ
ncbi:MAG: CBS domain-containing protein [Gemmatimonadales bacterium]|nr:CBS domain-containing protein [Gemmatimonadales bacterium]